MPKQMKPPPPPQAKAGRWHWTPRGTQPPAFADLVGQLAAAHGGCANCAYLAAYHPGVGPAGIKLVCAACSPPAAGVTRFRPPGVPLPDVPLELPAHLRAMFPAPEQPKPRLVAAPPQPRQPRPAFAAAAPMQPVAATKPAAPPKPTVGVPQARQPRRAF